MKRLVCLIFLIIFLTGCDAEYNITINKGIVSEELQIYEDDKSKWDADVDLFSQSYREVIEDNLNYKLGVFIDEQLADAEENNPNYNFYKPEKIHTQNRLGIIYKYNFITENYHRAYFPNNCFDNINLYKEKGYIILSTSKGFNCIKDDYELSSLTINITTKYEVEKSNSDDVSGKTYKWIINKNNSGDKNIYIKVNTNKLSQAKVEKENEEKIEKIFLTIGVSLAILLIIVIIFLVNKKSKLENY